MIKENDAKKKGIKSGTTHDFFFYCKLYKRKCFKAESLNIYNNNIYTMSVTIINAVVVTNMLLSLVLKMFNAVGCKTKLDTSGVYFTIHYT